MEFAVEEVMVIAVWVVEVAACGEEVGWLAAGPHWWLLGLWLVLASPRSTFCAQPRIFQSERFLRSGMAVARRGIATRPSLGSVEVFVLMEVVVVG